MVRLEMSDCRPPAPCIPVSTINIFLTTDIDLTLKYKQDIRFHYEIKLSLRLTFNSLQRFFAKIIISNVRDKI